MPGQCHSTLRSIRRGLLFCPSKYFVWCSKSGVDSLRPFQDSTDLCCVG